MVSPSAGSPRSSAYDIHWGVTEGTTYTWVVKESNISLGFLPVDSKFEITVNSIRSVNGGNATELNATITKYNSLTEQTTMILDNEMFIYFDSAIDYVSFYDCFYDHGFFAPTTDFLGFREGVRDYLHDFCGFGSIGTGWSEERLRYIVGDIDAPNLSYFWEFNDNSITNKLTVYHPGDFNEGIYQYLLELEISIPYGNFFLIFTGFTIISLIYIYRKKTK